ncbi:MAG: hypothetical protein MPN21_09545 [Thermoanaerobaculia bacterium]|nr:hypothetical protein [Thermoanaerobaculia bacterium]
METTREVAALFFGLTLVCVTSLHGQPAPAGAPFQVNVQTTDSQEHQSIASTPDGDFVIIWQSDDQDGDSMGIFARRFDSAGIPLTGEMQVNAFTAGLQHRPKALVGPQGLVAVWRDSVFDGDFDGIMVKVPGEDEFLANTSTSGNQVSPDLAMDSQGDFVVVWQNESGKVTSEIFGQRFDSAGDFVDSEFLVNTTTSGEHQQPAVDGIGDGRFVVAWDAKVGTDDLVLAQRFASDGSKEGSEIVVESSLNNSDASVAMAEDGSFVVVWRLDVGLTREVYSRHFDSDGVPTTSSLPLASTPGLGGRQPSVQRDPNGDFLVLWYTDISDVLMRRLGSDGLALEEETMLGQGLRPEVAFSEIADYAGLATWTESHTDGDNWGIYARRVGESAIFSDDFESGNVTLWSLVSP